MRELVLIADEKHQEVVHDVSTNFDVAANYDVVVIMRTCVS